MGTKRVIWIADDGVEFDSEDAMVKHETEIRRIENERRIEAFIASFGTIDDDWVSLTPKGFAAEKTRARAVLEKFLAFEEAFLL